MYGSLSHAAVGVHGVVSTWLEIKSVRRVSWLRGRQLGDTSMQYPKPGLSKPPWEAIAMLKIHCPVKPGGN